MLLHICWMCKQLSICHIRMLIICQFCVYSLFTAAPKWPKKLDIPRGDGGLLFTIGGVHPPDIFKESSRQFPAMSVVTKIRMSLMESEHPRMCLVQYK